MFNMIMNVIQLKTGIEGALAMGIPGIPKEQANPMDWEFTPTPFVVAELAIDVEVESTKENRS